MVKEFTTQALWTLIPAGKFPSFYMEVGTLTDNDTGKEAARFGVATIGTDVYLFTDRPHPDDPRRKATYQLSIPDLAMDAFTALPATQETQQKPQ